MTTEKMHSCVAMTTRRQFLSGACAAIGASSSLLAWAKSGDGQDIVITRVVGFDLPIPRSKYVGRNAYREPHGDRVVEPLLRIYASNGMEGFGWSPSSRDVAAKLLGRRLADLVDSSAIALQSPLERQTAPLWDLLGKTTGQPVYSLLGGKSVAANVPVYDGSIYFQDLLPQYSSTWQDQFCRELDQAMERGHRVFKVKIGRGHKWMNREEGDQRDVEVCKLLLKHLGEHGKIAVDANNGLDLERTKKFMQSFGPDDILFTEEMFEDHVENCLKLKEFYQQNGYSTLLADGETRGAPDEFRPFVDAGAFDLLQGDMNRFGAEGVLEEARMGRPKGIRVAPHNWGSLMGFYSQLHCGAAIDNFYMAEQDVLSSEAIVADGFQIKDGACSLPEKPGLGLSVNEDQLSRLAKVRFDVSA